MLMASTSSCREYSMGGMKRLRQFIVLTSAAAAGLFLAHGTGLAYTSFCDTYPSECEFEGPDAPVLQADVCWNGSVLALKSGNCPTGYSPYYVQYGEVDVTGAVTAYISLPDACQMGYCTEPPDPVPETVEGDLCCYSSTGTTWCVQDVLNCTMDIVWCKHHYTDSLTGLEICLDIDE